MVKKKRIKIKNMKSEIVGTLTKDFESLICPRFAEKHDNLLKNKYITILLTSAKW